MECLSPLRERNRGTRSACSRSLYVYVTSNDAVGFAICDCHVSSNFDAHGFDKQAIEKAAVMSRDNGCRFPVRWGLSLITEIIPSDRDAESFGKERDCCENDMRSKALRS